MRRFDVWVGRVAAAAGIVYVVLASLWPLSASAEVGTGPKSAIEDGVAHRVAVVEQGGRDLRFVCAAAVVPPPLADRQPLVAARAALPATCADVPHAPTIAMLVVSFVTVALLALLSRSDAMTARFYTDVG